MAGITNLAKGAAKNIAQALNTDGVGKALAKRAAMGAGIGAVGGGTLSAIQGGSFGEGAVRGGFIGAGIGAATGAYKMGAFGNSVLDEAGRFRKGATSVYSYVASGNDTWAQVNKYRQQDLNAFMNHVRNAEEGQSLAKAFEQTNKEAKVIHNNNNQNAQKQVNQNIIKNANNQTIRNSENINIQKRIDNITGVNKSKKSEAMSKFYDRQTNRYNEIDSYIEEELKNLSNNIRSHKKGQKTLNVINREGSKYAKNMYGSNELSSGQKFKGINAFLNSREGKLFMNHNTYVKKELDTVLDKFKGYKFDLSEFI